MNANIIIHEVFNSEEEVQQIKITGVANKLEELNASNEWGQENNCLCTEIEMENSLLDDITEYFLFSVCSDDYK